MLVIVETIIWTDTEQSRVTGTAAALDRRSAQCDQASSQTAKILSSWSTSSFLHLLGVQAGKLSFDTLERKPQNQAAIGLERSAGGWKRIWKDVRNADDSDACKDTNMIVLCTSFAILPFRMELKSR